MVKITMNVKKYILNCSILSEIDVLLSETAMSVSIYCFIFALEMHILVITQLFTDVKGGTRLSHEWKLHRHGYYCQRRGHLKDGGKKPLILIFLRPLPSL